MRVGELDLLPHVRSELLRQECWPQSIELSLLSIRQSCHQAQITPQRVILTQGPQTLRALREVCIAGRVCLTNCFAFIASFAQNTVDFKC